MTKSYFFLFVYFENVMLVIFNSTVVNLNIKVPHNSTDLYIIVRVGKFSIIQKNWNDL